MPRLSGWRVGCQPDGSPPGEFDWRPWVTLALILAGLAGVTILVARQWPSLEFEVAIVYACLVPVVVEGVRQIFDTSERR